MFPIAEGELVDSSTPGATERHTGPRRADGQQANKLKGAHANMTGALKDLVVIEDAPANPLEPKWLNDTAKQWGLLNDLKETIAG